MITLNIGFATKPASSLATDESVANIYLHLFAGGLDNLELKESS
jgi:hypothetical protein